MVVFVRECVCVWKQAARKHQVVSSTNTAWRVIVATKSAHPELGSLPIVVPIDEAVRRTGQCSPCVCVCVCVCVWSNQCLIASSASTSPFSAVSPSQNDSRLSFADRLSHCVRRLPRQSPRQYRSMLGRRSPSSLAQTHRCHICTHS